eukprot:CAMPEP_0168482894 /NCGR_PEP_ID=MMETSP0228-20121227/65276_1 /TAXON_ID=133427 /ORGANISM="Protoceratium reticulatum, Strain CCCM 535 (=CCMP 1889)" /LENGTH=438 /DNA_ID=CAMNT_0008499335 /DNA_START=25 /DNA_END=1342 /DNA_ORIENTATION=+
MAGGLPILRLLSCQLLAALAAADSALRGNASTGAPARSLLAPPAPGAAQVTVQMYYGPACTNCLHFLEHAIRPLLDAGLPGDRVKVSVLPFVKIEENVPVAQNLWDQFCRSTDSCFYALAPLCALEASVPAAAPADSPELSRGVSFAQCNQARRLASHPSTSMEVSDEMRSAEDSESRACAAQAGMPYDGPQGVKACADGPKSLSLIHSPGYTGRVIAAERTLKLSGKQMMPYVFLNGDVLRCDGGEAGVRCGGIWSQAGGDRVLTHPGTLLHVVCSRLNPRPDACRGVSATPAKVGPTPFCENCNEVRSFHWDAERDEGRHPLKALGAASAAFVAAFTVAALGWRALWRSRGQQQEDAEDGVPLVVETPSEMPGGIRGGDGWRGSTACPGHAAPSFPSADRSLPVCASGAAAGETTVRASGKQAPRFLPGFTIGSRS